MSKCPGCLDCTPPSLLVESILNATPRCGNPPPDDPPDWMDDAIANQVGDDGDGE